jgi:hypothetical protein
MSPTGARQDLQTIQQSVAAGSVVVASTGTGPFEQRHSADLFGALRPIWCAITMAPRSGLHKSNPDGGD